MDTQVTKSGNNVPPTKPANRFQEKLDKHEKRVTLCEWARYLVAGLMITGYLIYQLYRYVDISENSYTSTSISCCVKSIEAPYVVAQRSSDNTSDIYFLGVYINDTWISAEVETVYGSQINISTWTYDMNTPNWTQIIWDDTIIVIPPYHQYIQEDSFMYLVFYSVTKNVYNRKNVTQAAQHAAVNGLSYGLRWGGDSRDQLKSGLAKAYESFANNTRYSLMGTENIVYVDVLEEKNTITGTSKNHYTNTLIASISDISWNQDAYNTTDNTTGDHSYIGYYTSFYFYPNPSGLKTKIVTSRVRSLLDIAGAAGGVLSSLLTATEIFLLWILYGFSFGSIQYQGYANVATFDDTFKKRLKNCLKELGVLPADLEGDECTVHISNDIREKSETSEIRETEKLNN